MPYLFTCPIPDSDLGRTPKIVTIVDKPCQIATNALRVQHGQQAKKVREEKRTTMLPSSLKKETAEEKSEKSEKDEAERPKGLAVCVKGEMQY